MAGKDQKRRAVFVDRDGTIIHERNYLRKIKDVRLLSGSVEALKMLKDAGFLVVVVSNQSGVARGYLTEHKLRQIHDHLQKLLKKKGAFLDGIYYCPHGPDSRCSCRKPKLGMVRKAQKRFNIDLRKSYAVGDHARDAELGKRMGGKGIFILTGHGQKERKKIKALPVNVRPKMRANLLSAARYITRH